MLGVIFLNLEARSQLAFLRNSSRISSVPFGDHFRKHHTAFRSTATNFTGLKQVDLQCQNCLQQKGKAHMIFWNVARDGMVYTHMVCWILKWVNKWVNVTFTSISSMQWVSQTLKLAKHTYTWVWFCNVSRWINTLMLSQVCKTCRNPGPFLVYIQSFLATWPLWGKLTAGLRGFCAFQHKTDVTFGTLLLGPQNWAI